MPEPSAAAARPALPRLLAEPGLREEMRGKSLEQASQFFWQKAALTAEVYHHVSHQ